MSAPEWILEEILEAQADLQTGLGFFRLDARDEPRGHDDLIEERLGRSLARTHRLLEHLGRAMYDPATHPDIPPNWSCPNGCLDPKPASWPAPPGGKKPPCSNCDAPLEYA